MFVNSLLQCHHDLSKQKVKTADIQTICSPIDYDFKLRIFSSFSMLLVESWELWTLEPKLWTSQIWTLIHLINNFVCAKSSKLITLEENIISVQQLPLCFPLFFVFSSEALNSGIKAVLTELFFKMQFVKNVLVYVFGVFTLSFVRSSRPEVLCKKGVLRNFPKFAGKHLCQSPFFKKVRPATLWRKRLWCRCFPVNFAKFLRIAFVTEHL